MILPGLCRGKIFLCRQDLDAVAEEAARYLTGTAGNAVTSGWIAEVKPAEIVEIEWIFEKALY